MTYDYDDSVQIFLEMIPGEYRKEDIMIRVGLPEDSQHAFVRFRRECADVGIHMHYDKRMKRWVCRYHSVEDSAGALEHAILHCENQFVNLRSDMVSLLQSSNGDPEKIAARFVNLGINPLLPIQVAEAAGNFLPGEVVAPYLNGIRALLPNMPKEMREQIDASGIRMEKTSKFFRR